MLNLQEVLSLRFLNVGCFTSPSLSKPPWFRSKLFGEVFGPGAKVPQKWQAPLVAMGGVGGDQTIMQVILGFEKKQKKLLEGGFKLFFIYFHPENWGI